MLFTSPVTFTVNTIARIFNYRYNRQEGKTVVAEYFEPSASPAIAPTITVKQDFSSKTKDRCLVSFTCNQLLPDGLTYKPIIVNFTMVCDKQHTLAQRDDAMELLTVACNLESTRTGLAQRLV